MGGAVSSGRDNNELIDNLMGGNYIRSRSVERVFRALDRAEYMTPESRDQAYKDLAWRNGPLHMSSPCIYSEVMEGLELRPGLSFLNIGSGTGYLSTLAGLILGSSGISHGIEVHSSVVEYANKKLGQFLSNSPTLDEFDFCEPKFFVGNGLCLPPQQLPYDRVYCGAGCPDEYENYFKHLIKVGGVLVMPLRDSLLQVRRVQADQWLTRNLLTVSFAPLRVPPKEDALNYVKLEEQSPPRLQGLARGRVRAAVRRGVLGAAPELREPAPRRPGPAPCPRRICIPIEPGGAVEGLNILHDLDADTGANEMNALLSLVIRMDQDRVAGAIRFDRIESSHSDSNSHSRSHSRSHSEDSSDDDGPSTDQGNERRRRRSRPSRKAVIDSSDTTKTDEGRSTLSDSTSKRRDSDSSSYYTNSKNGHKSDRDRSKLARKSDDKNGRKSRDSSEVGRSSKETKARKSDTDNSELDSSKDKSARKTRFTSSEESNNSKDRTRRKSDRKSSGDKSPKRDRSGRRERAGSSRRSGSSGSLLAFEFQATDRSQQATTSAGAGRSIDNSTATSENDSGNKNKKKNKKSSRRPPCRACNPEDGDDIMPAEVKLCFRGRKLDILPSRPEPNSSYWDDIKTDTEEEESSNDEKKKEAPEPFQSKAKRQKLDSGIGENTPSSSSPDKSKAGESETDERPSDSVTDEAEPAHETGGRRRLHKRSRGAGGAGAGAGAAGAEGGAARAGSTSTSSSSAEEGRGAPPAPPAPARRRAARRARGYDARRVRLSILMKKAVKELPLPFPLQKYVNLGRCFEF